MLAAPPAFVRLAAHPLRWRLLTALAQSDYRVRELVAQVDEPQNVVSYHLRLLRDGGLVTSGRSSFDGRDSYYHLDLDRCADALLDSAATLHPALRAATQQVPEAVAGTSVLFVCSGGSARSPIAAALLHHHSAGRVAAVSAGSRPRPELHPDAVRVLREAYGADVLAPRPRDVHDVLDGGFDVVVTLCDRARETCPELPHQPRRVHWSIPDPAAAEGYPAFQRAAADLDTRVRHLLPVLAATTRPEVQP